MGSKIDIERWSPIETWILHKGWSEDQNNCLRNVVLLDHRLQNGCANVKFCCVRGGEGSKKLFIGHSYLECNARASIPI